jgi:hypothetical protein
VQIDPEITQHVSLRFMRWRNAHTGYHIRSWHLLPMIFLARLISVKTEQLEFSLTDKIMRRGRLTSLSFSQTENYHGSKIDTT